MKVLTHFILWSFGLAKPWTWYSEEECAALERYAKGKRRLIEIGCWQGVNTARLRGAMHEKGELYAIDPYRPGRLGFNASKIIAHQTVSHLQKGKIHWLQMTDLEAADYFLENKIPPVDFIFLDALNSYEGLQASTDAWHSHLCVGGILAIANSHSSRNKVLNAGSVRYTDTVLLKNPNYKLLEQPGCFTVLQKVSDAS